MIIEHCGNISIERGNGDTHMAITKSKWNRRLKHEFLQWNVLLNAYMHGL